MTTVDNRVEKLAARLESVNQDVMAACEVCSQELLQTRLDDDGRRLGVVFHHIAVAYTSVTGWAARIARDEPLPTMTMDQVHAYNAQHALDAGRFSKQEVMDALRQNAAQAAATLRGLTEAQLNKRSNRPLLGIPGIKAGTLVNIAAVEHARGHLAAIQAMLDEMQ